MQKETTNIKDQIRDFIQSSNGRFFSAEVFKADGTRRVFDARIKVSKGVKGVQVGRKAQDLRNGIVTVYDLIAKGFRCIKLENVIWVQVAGEKRIYASN